jgi:hypothetical protein
MKQFAGVMMALAVAGMPTNALASGQLWRGPCKNADQILSQKEFNIDDLIKDVEYVGTEMESVVPDELSLASEANPIPSCQVVWRTTLIREAKEKFLSELAGKTSDDNFYNFIEQGIPYQGVVTLKYKGNLVKEIGGNTTCKNSIAIMSGSNENSVNGYINIGFKRHFFEDKTCGIFLLFENFRFIQSKNSYHHWGGFAVPLGREGENRFGIDESFAIAFSDNLILAYNYQYTEAASRE